jgi:threonine synthase
MITPQSESPEIAKELGVPKLYFKREDLHPYGSHKGRSIPVIIDLAVKAGADKFALSSSGNAALAALRHIQKRNAEGAGLRLTIFIGKKIDPAKKDSLLKEIPDDKIEVIQTERPLKALSEKIKKDGCVGLRQSNNPDALLGYDELAYEIGGTPDLSAVFIGASSGTAAQAIAEHFIKYEKKAAVHIVQTTENSALVDTYGEGEIAKEKSIADAIVDKLGYRQDDLQKALEETGGFGWIASNDEIRRAQSLLKEKADIDATPNGALSLAGLMKAIKKGRRFEGSVVCVITGR